MDLDITALVVLTLKLVYGEGKCTRWELPSTTLVPEFRLEDRAFAILSDIILTSCAKECAVRTNCKSFNYNTDKRRCELNAVNLEDTPGSYSADYSYSDITMWAKEALSQACVSATCPEHHMCIGLTNGRHFCQRSECGEPPEVESGMIQSSLRCVGCHVQYACSFGYRASGSSDIECLPPGQWTTATIQCEEYYLGCYTDANPRDLRGQYTSLSQNSPEACINYCFGKGFAYAGVQYSNQCFCGDSYGQYGKLAEEACNYACPGDPAAKCGASWKSNIYATGANQ